MKGVSWLNNKVEWIKNDEAWNSYGGLIESISNHVTHIKWRESKNDEAWDSSSGGVNSITFNSRDPQKKAGCPLKAVAEAETKSEYCVDVELLSRVRCQCQVIADVVIKYFEVLTDKFN